MLDPDRSDIRGESQALEMIARARHRDSVSAIMEGVTSSCCVDGRHLRNIELTRFGVADGKEDGRPPFGFPTLAMKACDRD